MAMTQQNTLPSLSVQVWRYVVVGLINTGLGLAVILALHLGAGVDLVLSNAAGYGLGWLVAYGLNRSWTFGHRGRIDRTLPVFLILVLVAFVANILIISILQSLNTPYLFAQIAGTLFYSVAVFLGARHVVFIHRI